MLSSRNDFNHLTILFAEEKGKAADDHFEALGRAFKTLYHAAAREEAWRLYETNRPDIVLIDIDLPEISGFELIRRIRRIDSETPIVALSANRNETLLLQALRLHLEDYLLKPVRCAELMEVLLRCATYRREGGAVINLTDSVYYCYDSKEIVYPDRRIALTHKEIELLELLLSRRGCVVYYSEIEEAVWGAEVMSADALKTVVKKIRKKLPEGSIKNIVGVGYRFV